MYQLHTKKQQAYFREVIRLHYEEGYGEDKISQVLPINHATASRWISIFAKEKGKISGVDMKAEPQTKADLDKQSQEVKELQNRIKDLESKLFQAELKAEFYDEMINVAEAKFKIPIRKKAGAKQ